VAELGRLEARAGAPWAIALDRGADPQSVVRVDGELVYRPSFTHRARVAAALVRLEPAARPAWLSPSSLSFLTLSFMALSPSSGPLLTWPAPQLCPRRLQTRSRGRAARPRAGGAAEGEREHGSVARLGLLRRPGRRSVEAEEIDPPETDWVRGQG
jgi:hypothetical protein